MGCDIHIICEVKKNDKWELNSDLVFPNYYYSLYREFVARDIAEGKTGEDCTQIPEYAQNEFQTKPQSNRNYDWFSILANVRNGRGFAGVETGQGFKIISAPRGLPHDLSLEGLKFFYMPIAPSTELEDKEDSDGNYYINRESAEKWVQDYNERIINIGDLDWVSNPDYHSASYLHTIDFDTFDWNQVSMLCGYIPLSKYEKLRTTNDSPDSWSGMISGPDIKCISQADADDIIDSGESPTTRFYVNYHWPVVYSEWFRHSITNIVEPLRLLQQKYEDVRIVFTFDN